MPSVVHLVVTSNFAGAERYVVDVARETASRGWTTTVIGGDPKRMPASLGRDVHWLPGATPVEALRAVGKLGRQDVCHVHMTFAEGVAVTARPRHGARIIATRHFAAARGSSRAGRFLAPFIGRQLDRQIAISEFVAQRLEQPPDAVIRNGVPSSGLLWREQNRTVLVLQRLEPEKDTATALWIWKESRLAEEGWSLRIVGEGSERASLERIVQSELIAGVTFAGRTADVSSEFTKAGMMLAPAPAEPLGLAVLEAMAAGVPIVASTSGGHVETIGTVPTAPGFPPRDIEAGAAAVRSLRDDDVRNGLSRASRQLAQESFSVRAHVNKLLDEYMIALRSLSAGRAKDMESGP